jgi:uncharacterized glyoxalase superfamily protein PhnB
MSQMAKKTARSGGRKGKTAPPPKGKAAARAKAVRSAKAAPKAAPKARAKSKPNAPARPKAAARAKAAQSSPARKILPRHEPETLRSKAMSVALTVDDVERSMRFYVDGLGFYVKDRWERDGRLLGIEMVAGTAMIGLSQDDWAKGRDRTKGVGMRIYLETSQDVDELAARVKARGVEARGPETSSWGARSLHFTDPDGFQLTLYQELKKGG